MRCFVRRRLTVWIVLLAILAPLAVLGFRRVVRSSHYRMRFGSPTERHTAVRELADKSGQWATGSLMVALGDRDPEIRSLALRALVRFRATRALPWCRQAVTQEPDAEVRAMAASFLGEVQAPENVPALRAALEDDSEQVRTCAVTALGRLRADGAAQILTTRLADRSSLVREAAVAALGRLKDPEAVPALIGLLENADEAMRSRAQEALVAITGTNQGIEADAWRTWHRQTRNAARGTR
jgi:HEAT repeat protein